MNSHVFERFETLKSAEISLRALSAQAPPPCLLDGVHAGGERHVRGGHSKKAGVFDQFPLNGELEKH